MLSCRSLLTVRVAVALTIGVNAAILGGAVVGEISERVAAARGCLRSFCLRSQYRSEKVIGAVFATHGTRLA